MKKELDSNKLHLEEFQSIMQNVDRDEANSLCRILVRRYPDLVLGELMTYISGMQEKIGAFEALMRGDS